RATRLPTDKLCKLGRRRRQGPKRSPSALSGAAIKSLALGAEAEDWGVSATMTDLEGRSRWPDEVAGPEQGHELEVRSPRPSDSGPTPIRRLGVGIVAAVVFS